MATPAETIRRERRSFHSAHRVISNRSVKRTPQEEIHCQKVCIRQRLRGKTPRQFHRCQTKLVETELEMVRASHRRHSGRVLRGTGWSIALIVFSAIKSTDVAKRP
jgi:hypothetical protein